MAFQLFQIVREGKRGYQTPMKTRIAVSVIALTWATVTNSATLSPDIGPSAIPAAGENYMICYTIDGRTKGFANISYGGVRVMGEGDSSVTYDIWKPACKSVTADAPAPAEVVESKDFDGKIAVTVQQIETPTPPLPGAVESRPSDRGVYLGTGAGESNTTGKLNVAVGHQALQSVMTGEQNVGVGWRALMSLTGAKANVAVGTKALTLNRTGYNNTAVGTAALESNVSGYDNAAFGIRALALTRDGVNNTGIGTDAFEENVSGNRNTGLGTYSGRRNKTSSNNTVSGYASLYHYNGVIGSNTASGVNSLVRLKTGGNNSAFGVNAGYSAISSRNASWFGFEAGRHAKQKADVKNSTAIGSRSYTDADNQVTLGSDAVTQARTWGVFTFKKGYPIDGKGVESGSLFKGVDGGLYYKGANKVTRLD